MSAFLAWIIIIKILIKLHLAAGIIVLFGFLIKPANRRDVSGFRGKRYAHRGLHNETVPENSLAAFRRAEEKRIGVELDVQMTKDGQIVVFHDGTLKRMCNADGYLRDYTYDELCKLNLKDTDEKIPLFKDVLTVLNGVDLICELKSDNGFKNYELCEKTYELLTDYPGRFCVESFSPYLVRWFKKSHPEIIRGQLSCKMKENGHGAFVNFLLTNLMFNFLSRPDFIAYDFCDARRNVIFKTVKKVFRPLCVGWAPKGDAQIAEASEIFDTLIYEE